MNNTWRDEHHPSFVNFISAFLSANSFRLNFVRIAPVIWLTWSRVLCKKGPLVNSGRHVMSAGFYFQPWWFIGGIYLLNKLGLYKCLPSLRHLIKLFPLSVHLPCILLIFISLYTIQELRVQFARLHVVITLATKGQNDSFVHAYFKSGMGIVTPTFVPVRHMQMGFENFVRIAHSFGVCKQQHPAAKLTSERKQAVPGMDMFLKLITSIPGIDPHDANTLNQAIGSIEAIAKASKEYILENTGLSAEKAQVIFRFFRNPKF